MNDISNNDNFSNETETRHFAKPRLCDVQTKIKIMEENNNVIRENGQTLIFNGGNPLRDCPTDWHEAKRIQDEMNEWKDEYSQPNWKWDCGFKLDFDGPIININSRFYPPKTHQGSTWDGSVTISFLGKEIEEKKFDCDNLQELNTQVEKYIEEFAQRLRNLLNIT